MENFQDPELKNLLQKPWNSLPGLSTPQKEVPPTLHVMHYYFLYIALNDSFTQFTNMLKALIYLHLLILAIELITLCI